MAARITRRDWLKAFSTGMVGAMTLDLDKLLWVPGAKTIVLPPTQILLPHEVDVSLWNLTLRIVDFEAPHVFSTVGLQGPQALQAYWEEVSRTDQKVLFQERR